MSRAGLIPMMKKLVKTILNSATERSRIKKIAGLVQAGLPKEMEPARCGSHFR
jgi:hypothetical protein